MILTMVKGFTDEEVFNGEVAGHFTETFRSPCPMRPGGQEFVLENLNCPEGFCSWAYADIQKGLADAWLSDPMWRGRNPNYFSCTDIMRPVVFRLERVGS